MSKSHGELESGLTKFLSALYACFRCMSRFLICFQFCECPRFGRKTRKPKDSHAATDDPGKRDSEYAGSGSFSFPKRYILVIMTFLGFMNMNALRVNLNVALEAMVNNHTVRRTEVTAVREAEFQWDSRLQGIVLGSFYYGYAFLQLPAGYLALKFGGTRIFGHAIFVASLLTLLTPVAARFSVYGLIGVRVAEGLVLGAVFPSSHAIWSKWAPEAERTTLVTIATSGVQVGIIITMPLSGLLSKYGFDGGWASVFYCFGVSGILWFVAWQLIVHESPSVHPSITEGEICLIENSIGPEKENKDIPWKSILTSAPVWGIVFGHVASDWGFYTMLMCIPMFLLDVLHLDIQTMGFAAAAPFLVRALSEPIGGVTADLLRRKTMTTQAVRRIYYSVGAIGAGAFLVASGYASSATIAVTCMCIGVAASGLMPSGKSVNMFDIAPNYACLVMGLSNTAGALTGLLSPLLAGFLTQDKKAEGWQAVFWITFGIYLVGVLLFCLLMSAEPQPWERQEVPTPAPSEGAVENDNDFELQQET